MGVGQLSVFRTARRLVGSLHFHAKDAKFDGKPAKSHQRATDRRKKLKNIYTTEQR